MPYTLPWYQEIMLRHTAKMFGNEVLAEAIRGESMVLTDHNQDKLAFVLCGGSTIFNMLTERCRQRQVRESLMNHGIKEKFRWRYEKRRGQYYPYDDPNMIIAKSEKWYDTKEEAQKAGSEYYTTQNDFSISNNIEQRIESCCECTHKLPIRPRGMCTCALKWKKQNKSVLNNGEAFLLPELFNYSATDIEACCN